MKVFLGSSTEAQDQMREVASWLEVAGADVIPWDEPRLFRLGESTLEALIRISKSVDAAVFVFGEDDKVWYRSDTLTQPRDNVLLEYGLFVGVLGPKRAIIARSGNPKTAADLRGITWVDISSKQANRAQIVLKAWVQNLGRANEDPVVSELLLQRAVLAAQLEKKTQELGFAEGKFTDLKAFVQASGVIDFDSIDLKVDGHWKLLFDKTYFDAALDLVAKGFDFPKDLSSLLSRAGFGRVEKLLVFQGNNPSYMPTAATKLLRRFRGYEVPQEFGRFLECLPEALKTAIWALARTRVEAASTRTFASSDEDANH